MEYNFNILSNLLTTHLYNIFQTCGKNDCPDLNIALAMYVYDLSQKTQKYGPDGLDYEVLGSEYELFMLYDADIRGFLGIYYEDLVEAYQAKDSKKFNQVVLMGIEVEKQKYEERLKAEAEAQ